jgi:heme/copper-type cytochrome/quinol oxidase subunit 2
MTTASNQDFENIFMLWLIAGISVPVLLITSLNVYCCVPRANPEQTQNNTERNQQVSGTKDDEVKDTGEEADRANQHNKNALR